MRKLVLTLAIVAGFAGPVIAATSANACTPVRVGHGGYVCI